MPVSYTHLILGGDGAGAFLVGHEAVRELSVRSAAGGVFPKENGIENSLDADTVKAVAILRHVIDGINGAVQQLSLIHILTA